MKNTRYEAHHYVIFSMIRLPRLRSKYLPQHSVLKIPQSMSPLKVTEQVSHP